MWVVVSSLQLVSAAWKALMLEMIVTGNEVQRFECMAELLSDVEVHKHHVGRRMTDAFSMRNCQPSIVLGVVPGTMSCR